MWTQIRLLLRQSDQGPHCLPVCKNRFETSARIFSRRHRQTTFSDVVFLGALRVKVSETEGGTLYHSLTYHQVYNSFLNYRMTLTLRAELGEE